MRPDLSYKNNAINSEVSNPVCFVDRIDAYRWHFSTPASSCIGLRSLHLSESGLGVAENSEENRSQSEIHRLPVSDLKAASRQRGQVHIGETSRPGCA